MLRNPCHLLTQSERVIGRHLNFHLAANRLLRPVSDLNGEAHVVVTARSIPKCGHIVRGGQGTGGEGPGEGEAGDLGQPGTAGAHRSPPVQPYFQHDGVQSSGSCHGAG